MALTLFLSTVVLGQGPENSNQGESKPFSVLQQNDESSTATPPIALGVDRPSPLAGEQLDQLDPPYQLPQDDLPPAPKPAQDYEPQVLMRGQLHEAFAETHQADPQPNQLVSATPPEPINELPPEFRPEGDNVQWIPGYFAWDEIESDFIWISGVWRDVPPNQQWVPGYWEVEENGYRWISGFWTLETQQELSYLPSPPASIDRGPSIAAPNDDYFYCPGNWEYQGNNSFVWRTGHWQPRVDSWIWIPACYVWTPRGYIYRPGYWDYEFDNRGTVFAPVRFQQPIYQTSGYVYRPSFAINTGIDFFVQMFVRPNCNHYFYGDWYGRRSGPDYYRPWASYNSHYRHYDPLLAHYNSNRHRHNQTPLLSWVNNQHQYYANHHNVRPRGSFNAHVKLAAGKHDHRDDDYLRRATLASNYRDQARHQSENHRGQPNASPESNRRNRKIIQVDANDVKRQAAIQKNRRDFAEMRKKSEQDNRRGTPSRNVDSKFTNPQPGTNRQPATSRQPLPRQQVERQKKDFDRNQGKLTQQEKQSAKPRESGRAQPPQDSARQGKGKGRGDRTSDPQTRLYNTPPATGDKELRDRILQARLETQRIETQRNREEFARGQANRNRQAESSANSNRDSFRRNADNNAAHRLFDQVKRAREDQARVANSNAQRTIQQQRLDDQRKQIQRTREEFFRGQERQNRQLDSQNKSAGQQAQSEARNRDALRQAALDRQSRDAQNRALQNRAQQDRNRNALKQQQEQSRRAAQQNEQKRQQETAARNRADQQRRAQQQAQQQARQASDKAQRDAQNRARNQQRQADQARRAQQDQQRKAANQQRQNENRQKQQSNKSGKKKK